MIQLITPDRYGAFVKELSEMHRLRYRVFKERLGWDVEVSGDMEIDKFDACQPAYLLQKTTTAAFRAACGSCRRPARRCCARLFRRCWTANPRRRATAIWESSRFGVDLVPRAEDGRQHRASNVRAFRRHDRIRLDAPAHGYRNRDGCADGANSLPRELAAAAARLAEAIGKTLAVAGYLEVSLQRLARVREAGRLSTAVIRMPSGDSGPASPSGASGAAA